MLLEQTLEKLHQMKLGTMAVYWFSAKRSPAVAALATDRTSMLLDERLSNVR